MSVFRVCRVFLLRVKCPARDYSVETSSRSGSAEEYRDVAVYPEIMDISLKARRARAYQEEAEAVRRLETVEEKIFKVNMPRYYGWKCVMLEGDVTPLGCLPFIQHVTRTHLVKNARLPDFYLAYDSAASYMAKQIRPLIEDTIKFEYQDVRRNIDFSKDLIKLPIQQEEQMKSKIIIEKINRVITNYLAPNMAHIFDSQLDVAPRHESSWFAGGFPPSGSIKQRENLKSRLKEDIVKDRPMQYIGKPVLTLRSPQPLEPLIPYSEASNESLDVPLYRMDPRTVCYFHKYRHATNIPGFWPGDSHEFGLLSYHTRENIVSPPTTYPADYVDKSLDAQGILNSFGWLVAQASYQGFSTYNDITYPLVTQTVITNGQYWSLFAYQMNTMFTHHRHFENNKLRNICYSTGPMKLFEGIDNNGKLIGFNDDVLKMLLQLYINIPCERANTDMKPYLGDNVKLIADIEDDKRRNWLEQYYKHLVSNRPRHRLQDEVYHWEWIYKIMFKTRHMDNTRRFFVTPDAKHPIQRRLDEHTPVYIPKGLREEGYKSVVKWEKTYYP